MHAATADRHRLDRRGPVLVAAGALAGCTALALVSPEEPGTYPICPFLALTGYWCPGCGSLRAVGRLVRLDPAGAVAFNPLPVLVLPYLVYRYLVWTVRVFAGPRLPAGDLPPAGIWALLVVVLAFWVLRNVPIAPFTLLAPG